MISLKTNYPVAYDSPDHLYPWGTKNDNSTNIGFIDEICNFCELNGKSTFNFLDLGCAGGQLVIDVLNRGNTSVGLEGSDYSVIHKRANWPEYHNKNLFTCDITREYKIFENDKQIKFDVITAWEVIEHINEKDLKSFFTQINNNLNTGGIFCGSISQKEEVLEGYKLHQTVWNELTWYSNFPNILDKLDLELYDYPFKNKVREDLGSFHIILLKK